MRNTLAVEFGFDAFFAEDVDGSLVCREFQDARDVDCGTVGGAKDFILSGVIPAEMSERRQRRTTVAGMPMSVNFFL